MTARNLGKAQCIAVDLEAPGLAAVVNMSTQAAVDRMTSFACGKCGCIGHKQLVSAPKCLMFEVTRKARPKQSGDIQFDREVLLPTAGSNSPVPYCLQSAVYVHATDPSRGAVVSAAT